MSSPEQLPRFFLDRSLGRKAVPEALRADGWNLVTLAEHYGMPADEQVADADWIEEAAKRGWPILMKDKRIRHRQAEINAVIAHKARCFVITRGDLPSADMANRFIANKTAILVAIAQPGPYIFSVQTERLMRLYPLQQAQFMFLLGRLPWRGQDQVGRQPGLLLRHAQALTCSRLFSTAMSAAARPEAHPSSSVARLPRS